MTEINEIDLADDFLDGAEAITEFIKGEVNDVTVRRTYYLLEKKAIPGFKLGGGWCARKTTILKHLARLEAGEPAETPDAAN